MDCKIFYDKITTILSRYKNDIALLDFITLQAYIDLLFVCAKKNSEECK